MAVERIKNGVGNYPYSDCFFFVDREVARLSDPPTYLSDWLTQSSDCPLCLYLIRLGDPDTYTM